MNKRYIDLYKRLFYKNEKTPFSIGTFAVVALCLLALIVSTFTQVEIIHPWFIKNSSGDIEIVMKSYPYIPQIPVLLGVIALLGKKFGFFTVVLFILMGLFIWPVFALGGGLSYAKTSFFGYILGYIPAAIIAGNILNKGKGIKCVALAAIYGIFAIDITGFLYTLALTIFRVVNFSFLTLAINTFWPSRIIYDFICSTIGIYTGILFKYLFWPAMYTNIKSKRIETIKEDIRKKIKKEKTPDIEEFDIDLSEKKPSVKAGAQKNKIKAQKKPKIAQKITKKKPNQPTSNFKQSS